MTEKPKLAQKVHTEKKENFRPIIQRTGHIESDVDVSEIKENCKEIIEELERTPGNCSSQ